MTTAIKTAELVALPKEDLRARALALSLTLTGDEDVNELVSLIIENTQAVGEDAKPGVLISIHTRDQACQDFVLRARNVIAHNEKAKVKYRCFLQNREGSKYTKEYPGVQLTEKTFKEMIGLGCISKLPDGSQDKVLETLQASFESFEKVLLVRVGRMQETTNGPKFNQFVMLYCEAKQELVEQTL